MELVKANVWLDKKKAYWDSHPEEYEHHLEAVAYVESLNEVKDDPFNMVIPDRESIKTLPEDY